MDVEPLIACVTSYKVICNPIVFTASVSLPVLLITFCVSIIVFYFFFCSWFFRCYVLSISLSTTSLNATTSLFNSASCPDCTALFFLLLSALIHLSFILFGFFWLSFFFETFSLYIWMCLPLVKRCNFVTTQGGFCFGWFISGMTNKLYKLADMMPVVTSGLLYVEDVSSSSGTGSCWLEEVAADCCCWLLVIALSPLKRLLSIASLFSGYIPHFWNTFFTSTTMIDSHGSLNIFIKLVLQQFIGWGHPNVANFECVILLKWAFTGRNITTSSVWKIWVVWGGKQYKCILFSGHRLIMSIFRCDPCPLKISNWNVECGLYRVCPTECRCFFKTDCLPNRLDFEQTVFIKLYTRILRIFPIIWVFFNHHLFWMTVSQS